MMSIIKSWRNLKEEAIVAALILLVPLMAVVTDPEILMFIWAAVAIYFITKLLVERVGNTIYQF